MSTDELLRQNELADALLAKLESIEAVLHRVKQIWQGDELPTQDAIERYAGSTGAVAALLDRVKQLWESERPDQAAIDRYVESAAAVGTALEK